MVLSRVAKWYQIKIKLIWFGQLNYVIRNIIFWPVRKIMWIFLKRMLKILRRKLFVVAYKRRWFNRLHRTELVLTLLKGFARNDHTLKNKVSNISASIKEGSITSPQNQRYYYLIQINSRDAPICLRVLTLEFLNVIEQFFIFISNL